MKMLYTYYGDDFTGSTDVLEQLAVQGVPAVLFLKPPTPEMLSDFPGVRAIGVSGDSRSRPPAWMNSNLPAIFRALDGFHAPLMHYKVCSTFDSSPAYGSIGRAIELGFLATLSRFVPVVVGAPHLRRYVDQAQLFASGPDGQVHRIDQHPMRHHPVTPMREPDLRRHLALQTHLSIGHLDRHSLNAEALERHLAAGVRVILFDTSSPEDLAAIGALVWQEACRAPLFSASSSGLTAALIAAWREQGLLDAAPRAKAVEPVEQLLVVSGSCSAVTARQIRHAMEHGFECMAVNPEAPEEALGPALAALQAGRDVALYTALGAVSSEGAGDRLGIALGCMLDDLLRLHPLQRAMLCGGDTSSHAVQQLGLDALTWRASLQPGAPLCQAHGAALHRPLELVLKGGQVGTDDFFRVVKG